MHKMKCFMIIVGVILVWILAVLMLGSTSVSTSSYVKTLQGKLRFLVGDSHDGSAEKPEVYRRRIILTSEEEANIKACVTNKNTTFTKAGGEFWKGDVRNVRFSKHSYLTNQSIVMDIGGHIGSDTAEFIRRYGPRIIVFEPQAEFVEKLKEKFGKNPNVRILPFGLGPEDTDTLIEVAGKDGEGSTLYSGAASRKGKIVKIHNTTAIFEQIGLGKYFVDLIHIDCEGCEIDILESIVESNVVFNMRHIQFATHLQYRGVKNAVPRYCKIQEILKRTHKPSYQYMFVWESWETK